MCVVERHRPAGNGRRGYQNFKAAIYVPVNAVRQLQDPKLREQQYQRIAQQLRFDKVYLETYRGGQFADDASLEQLKKFFTDKGVAVSGGIALDARSHAGQFATLDYENPDDRAEPSTAATPQAVPGETARSSFHIVLPAHSYRAYSAQ
jgi:hypothetical protein